MATSVFTVRGIMKPGGLASAFGGNLAIMDIYAAQKIFGRGRKFDRIDIALEDGVTLERRPREIAARGSGRGSRWIRPVRAANSSKRPRAFTPWRSNITSLFALFIGMFIIYNTFAIAVTQRRSEIGILRALGATRSTDPHHVSRRERGRGTGRHACRRRVRHRHGARHGGLHRHAAGRRLRHRAAGRAISKSIPGAGRGASRWA